MFHVKNLNIINTSKALEAIPVFPTIMRANSLSSPFTLWPAVEFDLASDYHQQDN